MTDAVLDMRFAHYMGEFADDEGFLEATYQAALQVEKKKALRQAREQGKPAGSTPQTEEKRRDDWKKDPRPPRREDRQEARRDGGRLTKWENTAAALKGVPQQEIDAHKRNQDGCWRCGRTGHKTFECFSFQTVQGTALPAAPWKAAAVGESLALAPLPKRPREMTIRPWNPPQKTKKEQW